jgi:hypothetical protein
MAWAFKLSFGDYIIYVREFLVSLFGKGYKYQKGEHRNLIYIDSGSELVRILGAKTVLL